MDRSRLSRTLVKSGLTVIFLVIVFGSNTFGGASASLWYGPPTPIPLILSGQEPPPSLPVQAQPSLSGNFIVSSGAQSADWVHYQDPTYLYEFNYPSDWLLVPPSVEGWGGAVQVFSRKLDISLLGRDIPTEYLMFEIHALNNPERLSSEDYFQLMDTQLGSAFRVLSEENTIIGGYSTFIRRWQFGQETGVSYHIFVDTLVYVILKRPDVSVYDPVFDEILSTLKFPQEAVQHAKYLEIEGLAVSEAPSVLAAPPSLKFPWKGNDQWYYTGGPHKFGASSIRSGIDFAPGPNKDIFAAAAGRVTFAGWLDGSSGNVVKIDHGDGWETWYLHLAANSFNVQVGSQVPQGGYIGIAGNTGVGGGIHIHIELRRSGQPQAWHGQVIDGWQISENCNGYSGNDPKGGCTPTNYNGYMTYISTGRQVIPWVPPDNNQLVTSSNNPIYSCFPVTSVLVGISSCVPGTDTIPPSGNFISPSNGSTISSRTVTVAVNASDNSGGSGIREVRFSAKWGGNWYGIGTDSSSPYSIDWDWCNNNVPNGDVELGMEVWDNAGNRFIWSEQGANPHVTKNYNCAGGGDTQPGGSWNTNAWQNKYLAGSPNWQGTFTWDNGNYPYVYLDMGSGGPPSFGWGGNEFSMRLWRSVYFPGGDYSFHTDHDDGVRVYVDGTLILDAWWDGRGRHDAGRTLSSGYHEVKIEYYENLGDAFLAVWWYGPGYPRPDNSPPSGRITSPTHLSATNQSPLSIWAEASDDASGVNRVVFYAWYCYADTCDWRVLGTDYSAPYNYDWDWSSIGDRHVWLAIDIFDNTGKVAGSTEGWVEVDLDRVKPVVSFLSPQDGEHHLDRKIAINVSANDNLSGISFVTFYAGYNDPTEAGVQSQQGPPCPPTSEPCVLADYWKVIGNDTDGSNGWGMVWDASTLPDGTIVAFFVYVYDKAGNYEGAVVWNNVLGTNSGATCQGESPTIVGTAGNDRLTGTPGDDVIVGLAGNDRIYGKGGNDLICGGEGNDKIKGGAGDDQLYGEAGNDNLKGGNGDDQLFGGEGNDKLVAANGNDTLDGQAGSDNLNGGKGTDTCLNGEKLKACEA